MKARVVFQFVGRPPAAMAAVILVSAPGIAFAQTAEVRYQRAQARETALREANAPGVASLRALAAAYEQIPRRYPRSGYSDNALWPAFGLSRSTALDPAFIQEPHGDRCFMLLTGRQDKIQRFSRTVGPQVDLGRPAAATAA